jgi:hypothetical protein
VLQPEPGIVRCLVWSEQAGPPRIRLPRPHPRERRGEGRRGPPIHLTCAKAKAHPSMSRVETTHTCSAGADRPAGPHEDMLLLWKEEIPAAPTTRRRRREAHADAGHDETCSGQQRSLLELLRREAHAGPEMATVRTRRVVSCIYIRIHKILLVGLSVTVGG